MGQAAGGGPGEKLQRAAEPGRQQWGPELCEISMLKEAEYIVRLAKPAKPAS